MLVALRPLAVGWAVLSCCDRWYREAPAGRQNRHRFRGADHLVWPFDDVYYSQRLSEVLRRARIVRRPTIPSISLSTDLESFPVVCIPRRRYLSSRS